MSKKNNPYANTGKTIIMRKKVTGALLSMSYSERLSYSKYTLESLGSLFNKDKSSKMSEFNASELAERLTPQQLITTDDYSKLLDDFSNSMLDIYREKNPLASPKAKSKELHQIYLGDSNSFELKYPEGMNPTNINCSLDEFVVTYTIKNIPIKVIFKLSEKTDSGMLCSRGYEFRNIFSATFVSDSYKKSKGQKREELKFLNYEFAIVTAVDSSKERINFDNTSVKCRNLPVFVYECRKLNIGIVPSYIKEHFADIVCKMFFSALDALENIPVVEGEHLTEIKEDPNYIHETVEPGHEVDLLSRDYDDESEGAKKTRAYTHTCEKWYVKDYYRKGKLVHGYYKGPKRNDPNVKPVIKTYVKV